MADPTARPAGWYPSPEWPNLDQWWTGTAWSQRTRAPEASTPPRPAAPSDAAPPLPAPGWYPSPANSATEQYWDGLQWTPSTRAAAGAPPPQTTTPASQRRNGPASAIGPRPTSAAPTVTVVRPADVADQTLYAWGIALCPLVFVPFVAMLNPLWQLIPLAITIAALVFLTHRDRDQLRADGRDASWPVWFWLFGPVILYPVVYLIRRTLALRSTVALPITSAACMVGVAVLFLSGYRPDWAPTGGDSFTFTSSETADIEQGIGDQIGEAISADCHTPRDVENGDRFRCDATVIRTGEAFQIRVAIGSGGRYRYQVVY